MGQLKMFTQDLPNSGKFIDLEANKCHLIRPVFYCYDLSQYSINALINTKHFQSSEINPAAMVDLAHSGIVKLNSSTNLDKVDIEYKVAKDFENAYDYEQQTNRIKRILLKNNVVTYYAGNKLFINAGSKDAKGIINCIKTAIIRGLREKKTDKKDLDEFRKNLFLNQTINLEKFMTYLIERCSGNVQAIYLGELPQKENRAMIIYGDGANNSEHYSQIKEKGKKVSCITVRLNLSNSDAEKLVLFNKDGGVMIYGAYSEERALSLVMECYSLIESFIDGTTNF